jgi:hypothetical protein
MIAAQQPVLGHSFTVSSSIRSGGLMVPVDMSMLIKSIVVTPQFPSWAIQALERVVKRSSLIIDVQSSDLLKRP